MDTQFYKNMALWVVILLMLLMLFTMLRANQFPESEMSYSDFISRLDGGDVESVVFEGNRIVGSIRNYGEFVTHAPAITDGLLAELKEKKVQVGAREPRESPLWQTMLIYWFPFLLFIGLWIFFVREMRKPN